MNNQVVGKIFCSEEFFGKVVCLFSVKRIARKNINESGSFWFNEMSGDGTCGYELQKRISFPPDSPAHVSFNMQGTVFFHTDSSAYSVNKLLNILF